MELHATLCHELCPEDWSEARYSDEYSENPEDWNEDEDGQHNLDLPVPYDTY